METTQKIYGYVRGQIEKLDNQNSAARATLAKLRRGVGKSPGEIPDILEITIGGLPSELAGQTGEPSYTELATYTAITLYALHQQGKDASMHADKGLSLGAAAARLIAPDKTNEEAVRRRFDTVTTSRDMTELAQHARSLVQLLHAAEAPIKPDYAQLAVDLFFYQTDEGRKNVRLKWCRDFCKSNAKVSQVEIVANNSERNEDND
jgi:CRISPR system Cascade subunit CasB